ncbi:Bax inhibitor-1/YccA family protein [Pedobacter sp. MR2016-19]|uniref:Bax inhibitor-1/YccA family protein n=1 Tax=unclassified Pedobacter TaxID=2628915 RepID=UPI0018762D63|nr:MULTISPECIES: Bax inhibitor-1/YccA family protein [unclassified Pedobacter]MBE5319670.1 Bax inhibitor-1/YccA family protein [Pedobacter sp. MR2016-19]QXU40928.1 Bax inhibitor-1/YccA family protein [Pedobacter sp. D749]
MEQQNYQYQDNSVFVQEKSVSKKFFANVFLWMFVALSLSTVAAYLFGTNEQLMQYLLNINPATGKVSMSIFGYVAMFAPLGLVLLMGFGLSRLSLPALIGVFVLYSLLTGVSLSFILLTYTSGSVVSCFAGAAGIFGIMAFMGYTTNIDLSKFGPILMVGVIGLVIASVINMFVQSEQFSLFMAFIGIAIFTALTAYDVQKIKRIGEGIEASGEQVLQIESKKMAIVAALSLYLDFLNIFLFLLRIFGSRK